MFDEAKWPVSINKDVDSWLAAIDRLKRDLDKADKEAEDSDTPDDSLEDAIEDDAPEDEFEDEAEEDEEEEVPEEPEELTPPQPPQQFPNFKEWYARTCSRPSHGE
jgi:hypothetical protein